MPAGEKKEKIKIVILLGAPLSEQNYERVGIPYLEPFFEVTVLDCMPWLGRNNDAVLDAGHEGIGYIEINTELDLENAIRKCAPSFAIDFVGRGSHTQPIQKILSKLGVKFVVQKTGTLPDANPLTKILRLFADSKKMKVRHSTKASGVESEAVARNRIDGLWGRLTRNIALRRHLKAPDVALLAGRKSLDRWTKKAHQIIWIGSQDYHLFKRASTNEGVEYKTAGDKRFVLFIDDCLPHASDWSILNIEPPVNAPTYYLMLLNFFEKIEEIFNLPVVIAAHPNGVEVKNYVNNFGGRQVISGKTHSLVRESILVLTHASTATSFAILARKPIIFIATAELRDSFYGTSIENIAKSIGQKMLVVDELSDKAAQIRLPEVNEALYRRYEYDYLKNERSQEDAPWDAFIKYVMATNYRPQ